MDPTVAEQPSLESVDSEVFTVERARLVARRNKQPRCRRCCAPLLLPRARPSCCRCRCRPRPPPRPAARPPGSRSQPLPLCRPLRALFFAGFACLPLLWAANVWLFWPQFRHGSDPLVQKCGPHAPALHALREASPGAAPRPAPAPANLRCRPRPRPADTRYSAAAFVAVSAVFVPWMLTFMIGGPAAVGQAVFDKMDATAYNYLNLGNIG
jgi:hypothetical protein